MSGKLREMRLDYDACRNTLRLTSASDKPAAVNTRRVEGTIDVAPGGRLIGIEFRPHSESGSKRSGLESWLEDPTASQFVSVDDAGSSYIEMTRGSDDDFARSCPLSLELEIDSSGEIHAIIIPRRGAGYEISYPSGNR